jgi:hypothetical protein
MKYFLIVLILFGCVEVKSEPKTEKRFPYIVGKDEFFASCEKELPYYKCEILFSQKDNKNCSGPGMKEFIIGGAAAGAASSVMKGLLK